MTSYSKKINDHLDKLSKLVEAKISVEALTDWKLIKLNCLACGYTLAGLVSIVCLMMLINSECREPIIGCLIIKVLSEIYRMMLTIIAPQIFLVFVLSLIIKNQGILSLKKIITNLFFLFLFNIFLIFSIVYIVNYTEVAHNKIFIAIALTCPLISHLISDITLKFLKIER